MVPQPTQQMGGRGIVPARSVGRVAAVEPQTVQQMGNQGLSPDPSVGRAAVGGAVVPQPAQQREAVGRAAVGEGSKGQLKYHEDVWLSGAVNVIRGEPNCAPARWARKIEEQAKKYRITFGPGGCPLAIFSVPGVGGLSEEQVKEIPALARRIALVAEAHEMGHLGAENTARRLWDSGFDWLGLLQDCEVITSVCRPCARDNAHQKRWAPALSLEVPHRVF